MSSEKTSDPIISYPDEFDRVIQFFLYEFLVALMRDMHAKREKGFSKRQVKQIEDYFGYIHSISVTFGDKWWFVVPVVNATIEKRVRDVWSAFRSWALISERGVGELIVEREHLRTKMGKKISSLSAKYRKHGKIIKSNIGDDLISKDLELIYGLGTLGLSSIKLVVERLKEEGGR